MSTKTQRLLRPLEAWHEEDQWYEWNAERTQGTCNVPKGVNGVCGHYTQMIWANTRKVGCGIRWCKDITESGKSLLKEQPEVGRE